MKFHEHLTGCSCSQRDADEVLASTECGWRANSRPYYKAWPSIVSALTKLKLDAEVANLQLGSRCVLIRFADGKEPDFGGVRIRTILTEVDEQWLIMFAQQDWGKGRIEYHNAFWFCLSAVNTFEEEIDRSVRAWRETIQQKASSTHLKNDPPEILDGVRDLFGGLIRLMTRISVTVHLLADDPSIITPDVLSKDRDKFDRTTDEAARRVMVERARRRGIVGWNIGADYEVCPHYRRPHFGLRHTGKNGTVPRIVPIKGAVVHRSRLTDVPTGYQLPDGTEVEHGKVIEP